MALERSIAPRNSIIFILDPTQRVEIPKRISSDLVAATSTCISVGTLAEMDGETLIKLAKDFDDPTGEVVFNGTLQTPGLQVSVSNAHAETILAMEVPAAVTKITIWANDRTEPDIILVKAR